MKYKEAGVDITKADKIIDWIKKQLKSLNAVSAKNIGKFAGRFPLTQFGLKDFFLYASVDGVGTKTKLASATGKYEIVGYDIFAHCINDLMVQGAHPLFLLDYIAMGTLNENTIKKIFNGMIKCAKECNVSMLGGETAEMPGIYYDNDFDLVGFVLGIGNKKKSLPKLIKPNNIIIGVNSLGLHTNGYSLVRKIINERKLDLEKFYPEINSKLSDALMKPHCCYYKILNQLINNNLIQGAAHVTGSGIAGNLKRILSQDINAVITKNSWKIPPLFEFIKNQGNVPEDDMFATFNMGIGLILIAQEKKLKECLKIVKKNNLDSFEIGKIIKGNGNVIFD